MVQIGGELAIDSPTVKYLDLTLETLEWQFENRPDLLPLGVHESILGPQLLQASYPPLKREITFRLIGATILFGLALKHLLPRQPLSLTWKGVVAGECLLGGAALWKGGQAYAMKCNIESVVGMEKLSEANQPKRWSVTEKWATASKRFSEINGWLETLANWDAALSAFGPDQQELQVPGRAPLQRTDCEAQRREAVESLQELGVEPGYTIFQPHELENHRTYYQTFLRPAMAELRGCALSKVPGWGEFKKARKSLLRATTKHHTDHGGKQDKIAQLNAIKDYLESIDQVLATVRRSEIGSVAISMECLGILHSTNLPGQLPPTDLEVDPA